jgi:hypothetical protein
MGKMDLLNQLIRRSFTTIIRGASIICCVIFLYGSFACAETPLTISANGAPSDEISLTPEQLKEYEKTYSDPFVIRIRRFLDGYTSSPQKIDEAEKIAASSLDSIKIDKKLLKTKFIVYWFTGALGGGRTITVIFQKSPNVILDFWVYQTSDGIYQVREVSESKFDNNEKKQIKKIYRRFLKDPKRAL